ncbi:MAG: T9SS type A sorting domain-containing protein [Candidatus Electryonea clarkiae]|nr:T9SS type A sorting domain-containing protein [Candidatus Electryonea clarkiae]MDP8286916.1 T9SS type A sorting domain-containing protein [Candidatus Electryonea clarkiae]
MTHSVIGNTITDNGEEGMIIANCISILVTTCIFEDNYLGGLSIHDVSGGLLQNNTFQRNGPDGTNNGYGLCLYNSSPRLYDNTMTDNNGPGLKCYDSSNPNMTRQMPPGRAANSVYNNNSNETQAKFVNSLAVLEEGHNNIFGSVGYYIYETADEIPNPPNSWDIYSNFYNNNADEQVFSSTHTLDYDPEDTEWNEMSDYGTSSDPPDIQLWKRALRLEEENDDEQAATNYFDLLRDHSESSVFTAAFHRLIGARWELAVSSDEEPFTSNEIVELENILDDQPELIQRRCNAHLNELKLIISDPIPVLEAFEERIENPVSEVDSIFALIDYGDAVLQLQGPDSLQGRRKGVNTKLPEETRPTGILNHIVNTRRLIAMIDGAIGPNITLPKKYRLYQNYPNPFNPTTVIRFDLPKNTKVSLIIYNILGQKVKELTSKYYIAGRHQVLWDSKSDARIEVSSGMYFVRMKVGKYVSTKKLVLLK